MTRPEKSYSSMTDDELIRIYRTDDDVLVRELCTRVERLMAQLDILAEVMTNAGMPPEPVYTPEEIDTINEQLELFDDLLLMNQ